MRRVFPERHDSIPALLEDELAVGFAFIDEHLPMLLIAFDRIHGRESSVDRRLILRELVLEDGQNLSRECVIALRKFHECLIGGFLHAPPLGCPFSQNGRSAVRLTMCTTVSPAPACEGPMTGAVIS